MLIFCFCIREETAKKNDCACQRENQCSPPAHHDSEANNAADSQAPCEFLPEDEEAAPGSQIGQNPPPSPSERGDSKAKKTAGSQGGTAGSCGSCVFIHGDLPTPHELAAGLPGPLPSEGSPADSAPTEAMEEEECVSDLERWGEKVLGSPMSPKQPDDELLAEMTANEANVGKGLGTVSSHILLQPTAQLLRQNAFLEGEDHYGPHTPVPAQAPSLSTTRRLGSFGSQSDLSDMLQQVEDAQQEPDQVGDADSVEPEVPEPSEPPEFAGSSLWEFLSASWPKLTQEERTQFFHNLCLRQHGVTKAPTVVTMCSGSGMGELAHRFLCAAFKTEDHFCFGCEKEPWKRKHLLETVHPELLHDPEDGCLFNEFIDLQASEAMCARHSQLCPVRSLPFLAIIGYSCKNLSRMNSKANQSVLRSMTGSSGQTAEAMLRYLETHRPMVALLENVEEMARDADVSDNVLYLFNELEKLGYAFATKLFDTSHYGLPQARKRAWQILLNEGCFVGGTEQLEQRARDMLKLAEHLQIPEPWSLERHILPDDAECVKAELERKRLHKKAEGPGDQNWRKHHREFFQSKGMSWSRVQAPAVANAPGFELLTMREKEALAFGLMLGKQRWLAQAVAEAQATGSSLPDSQSNTAEEDTCAADSQGLRGQASTALKKFCAVDVSQRLDRLRVCTGPVTHTMLPEQKTWVFALDGQGLPVRNHILTGAEALKLQGWPLGQLRVSDPQQADLAGNSFSSTVVLALLLALYTLLPEYKWSDEGFERLEKSLGRPDPEVLAARATQMCHGLDDMDSD